MVIKINGREIDYEDAINNQKKYTKMIFKTTLAPIPLLPLAHFSNSAKFSVLLLTIALVIFVMELYACVQLLRFTWLEWKLKKIM